MVPKTLDEQTAKGWRVVRLDNFKEIEGKIIAADVDNCSVTVEVVDLETQSLVQQVINCGIAICRMLLVVVLGGWLSACAGFGPTAPMTPTTTQIAAEAVALQSTGLDPITYAQVCYVLNAEASHEWFASLAQRANSYQTAAQGVGLAGTAAMGIQAASGSNPAALIVTGIVSGLTAGVLNGLSTSTGIPLPAETAALVRQAQATFLGAAAAPTTMAEAALLCEAESWLSSLPGAEWLASQAVSTAQTSVAPNPGVVDTFMTRGLTRAIMPVVPPSIVVNRR